MNVFLDTIGCRLNQSEIEIMAAQFRQAGHIIVATAAQADLVVINTCAVTGAAASDSRQKIRQAAQKPDTQIVVTGCWATIEPESARSLAGVDRVVANSAKAELVSDYLHINPEIFDFEPITRIPLPGEHKRTRAFIKVQDGCDNFCTFCVTKIARGKGVSEPLARVMTQIQHAIDGGVKEVVLSGVHLGSWGQDLQKKSTLGDLIKTILNETDITRLRLSSLEPWDLDEEFFQLWQNERMCDHLHLPLQSGSDSILRRMARKTSQKEFRDIILMARRIHPGIALTTDMIVGFPGETEENFSETLAFIREIEFAGGHVFTFSARPGTSAATFPDQVHGNLRKQRSARLRAVFLESAHQYQRQFIGGIQRVLWESSTLQENGLYLNEGLSTNYLRVQSTSLIARWNQIDSVRITQFVGEFLWGEIE